MNKILIINANPKANSLCKAISERYQENISESKQAKVLHIGDMDFQLSLDMGYEETMALEPSLKEFQQSVQWADHIVIVSPVWWGTMPAKLKALFDRAFLPGFAFRYVKGKAIPEKLLKGRTAELIFTLDTPVFWYKWIQGNPIYLNLKRTILDFAGIKNVSANYFGPVINSTDQQRQKWLQKVEALAASR